jgi:hypothetical protein
LQQFLAVAIVRPLISNLHVESISTPGMNLRRAQRDTSTIVTQIRVVSALMETSVDFTRVTWKGLAMKDLWLRTSCI